MYYNKRGKLIIENEIQNVLDQIRRNGGKNALIYIAFDPTILQPILVILRGGKTIPIKQSENFIFVLGGVQAALNTVRSWHYAISAVSERLANQGFFD